jgi:hypothetical protein
MSKQLIKRHKRAVARAKAKKEQTEPDVRTADQIQAARDASRPKDGWGAGSPNARGGSQVQGRTGAPTHSASKSDA